MRSKAKAAIVNRGGFTIPEGASVTATWDDKAGRVIVTNLDRMAFGGEVKVNLRPDTAHKYLTGFKARPSDRALERASYDGVCASLTGRRVEPDGYDEHGFPSWLLALGYV